MAIVFMTTGEPLSTLGQRTLSRVDALATPRRWE
jgi:hypothetical protein